MNCREIERIFTNNGYQAIYPEKHSLTDLIARMDVADEIVSFGGSTAHNFLFTENKNLVILERCGVCNLYQIGIQKMLNGVVTLVDGFYQPLLASSCDDLTIYAMTPQLRGFLTSRGIDEEMENHPLADFRRYLKIYQRHCGYGAGLNQWEADQYKAILEVYVDSQKRFGAMVMKRIPVLWSDFFSPRVLKRYFMDKLRSLSVKKNRRLQNEA